MNQKSDDQELSGCDVKPRQKRVLHFSSGEILTESEEEEDEHELHQTFCVSEQVRSDDGWFLFHIFLSLFLSLYYGCVLYFIF